MVGQAPNMTVAVEKVDEVHFDIKTTNTLNARAAYEEAFELDLHQNDAFDVAGARSTARSTAWRKRWPRASWICQHPPANRFASCLSSHRSWRR